MVVSPELDEKFLLVGVKLTLGTWSAKSSMTMRPAGAPPMETSKKTLGLGILMELNVDVVVEWRRERVGQLIDGGESSGARWGNNLSCPALSPSVYSPATSFPFLPSIKLCLTNDVANPLHTLGVDSCSHERASSEWPLQDASGSFGSRAAALPQSGTCNTNGPDIAGGFQIKL